MARTGSVKIDGPYPKLVGPQLAFDEPEPEEQTKNIIVEDGALKIDNADGTTTIQLNPSAAELAGEDKEDNSFYANLAKKMDEGDLSRIATELLDGVMRDDDSRKEWLETRALGIGLLGLKLEKPRSDAGASSAPLEGMSTVRHPLLLEATVSFQATARAELLPAAGPVKVRNDTPFPPASVVEQTLPKPPPPPQPSGLSPPPEPPLPAADGPDSLAQALEKDFNHYLTSVATEYVPDTDRMLFYVGFGGDGFKKVYNCPLRRRPVSESIDAEDLIVSNAATDLHNCQRITHRIKMRRSILKRMQILGEYRDVDLALPSALPQKNPVEKMKEEIAGVTSTGKLPEDRDYEVYEIYCELDLDEHAPKRFKGKGLPLPYRVTIEKESRQILDIRKNWEEDDKECMAKRYFVQFPLIRGLGFYGLGYIHLLGNTTVALTAAWRLQLDNGMFSNFPGFLYAKGIGRQYTNQFRVPPGGGVPIDVGANGNIRDAVMPLPYKETGPSFSAFSTHVEEVGRRLASTANINVGEGKQDAPVGTTLALIEQASKVMDSAHKRLHAAQAEEFMLLKERFKEDPEAFWRHTKKTTVPWQKEQFLKALEDHNIVPVADPNNPTSLHRMAKAMAIKELQKASPELYDPMSVDRRVMAIADINPEGLFRPKPAAPPPDPRMEAIKTKAAASDRQNQIQLLEAKIKAATAHDQLADKEKDRVSRERLEEMRIQLEMLKMQREGEKAQEEGQIEAIKAHQEMQGDIAKRAQDLHLNAAETMMKLQHDNQSKHVERQFDSQQLQHEDEMAQRRHEAEANREHEKHQQTMRHAEEMHKAKLEAAKKMATVAKRDKSKPSQGKK